MLASGLSKALAQLGQACYTFRTTGTEFIMRIEIKKIGNSTGLILPKELMNRLNLHQGDWVDVTEMADGSVRLSPHDPVFEKGMEIAEGAIRRYRNALKTLAK
jgi:putative addiction module antidote